jgi:hypothetical protein
LDVTLSVGSSVIFTRNSNGQTESWTFLALNNPTAPGQFVSYSDPNGIVTSVSGTSGALITQLTRVPTSGTTDTLTYAYNSYAKIQTVTWARNSGSGPVQLKQVAYAYWSGTSGPGNANDLQSASSFPTEAAGGTPSRSTSTGTGPPGSCTVCNITSGPRHTG